VTLTLVGAAGNMSSASASAIGSWTFGSPCPEVLVIGARGSGQERDASGKFTEHTPTLGLGAEIFGFYQKLGDAVGDRSVAELPNPYAAIPISQFGTYDIFRSLDEGKTNTRVLVAGVAHACPTTHIVLAGYSQGAWATKEGAEFVRSEDHSHVSAMVLLADPTFDPSGGGTMIGTYDPKKGGVAARGPVPAWIRSNTVSACLRNDLVCQSDSVGDLLGNLFDTSIHTAGYQDPNLLRLVAAVVASRFRGSSVDLVFAVDTTGSMGPYIGGVKLAATNIMNKLLGSTDARIGLVDYKDLYSGCPTDGYAARSDLPFSTDKSAIQAAINSLSASGGCDTPESVYSGLIQAIKYPWRGGVKKEIVLMGDAPPHDPEPVTGYTLRSVVAAARAVDPAVINTIDIHGGGNPYFSEITTETLGEHFLVNSPEEAIEAILGNLAVIAQGPIANAGGPYASTTGTPVLLDASASFSPIGTIAKYEWDFNDDGVYDATTAAPAIEHTYSGAYDGPVDLRVTDDQTPVLTAVATAHVSILSDTTPPTMTCAVRPDSLWPPNHKLVPVNVSIKLSDTGSGPAGYSLVSATSSEPDRGLGDGDTGGDIRGLQPGSSAVSGALRAERSGSGPGRTYTLTYEGKDNAGNAATCVVRVAVPHSR